MVTTVINITLTDAEPVSDPIDITQQNMNIREYSIGNFGGETLTIERYLSDLLGWIPIVVSPTNLTPLTLDSDAAGLELVGIARVGKIRFKIENTSPSSEVKISIATL